MDVSAVESAQPWTTRFRNIRVLSVLRVANVTPLMRRVTLGGAEIEGIPDGPNIKLLIPPAGGCVEWPLKDAAGKPVWPHASSRPVVRTYTVRRHDRAAGELDVDFVLHDHHGVASDWARHARVGDSIGIGGPGGRSISPADAYVFAGDHSALPAVGRILEDMPRTARGHAFIEVPNAREEQKIDAPSGVSIHWLHRDGEEAGTTGKLADAVKSLAWPAGNVFAWIGAESAATRDIRAFIKSERGLAKHQFLAIGYWKRGLSETAYHDEHDHDRGADYHEVAREHLAEARHG